MSRKIQQQKRLFLSEKMEKKKNVNKNDKSNESIAIDWIGGWRSTIDCDHAYQLAHFINCKNTQRVKRFLDVLPFTSHYKLHDPSFNYLLYFVDFVCALCWYISCISDGPALVHME